MQNLNNILNTLINNLEKGEEITPFLFIGTNIAKINKEIDKLCWDLCELKWVNINYIFKFSDDNSKIKVKDIKEYFEKIFITPPYSFQIFFIENIWRMTEESANSCLKVFEEPWVWNLIFLTNESESNILDTILSRCTIINLDKTIIDTKNEFYYNMIDDYIRGINYSLASFVFKEKLEKDDYINILKNIILYLKDKLLMLELIDEINDDINWIIKNNLLPKYIVDKYVIKIKNI